MASTIATSLAIAALLLIAYVVTPEDVLFNSESVVRIAVAVVAVVAAFVFAALSVLHARYPMLRAIEALTAVVGLLIVVFAYTYLVSSTADPAAYSEQLDHTKALYFALTTATTVGFGDITPRSNGARIAVMVQMVSNVVVIGVAARVLLGAARRRAHLG